MSDRAAYTSSTKQNGTTAAGGRASNQLAPAARTGNPQTHFPGSTKTQPCNPTRHHTRPIPNPYPTRRGNRRNFTFRRCFCLTCFWVTVLLIGILLLAAIAAAAFYLLYHPHRPEFSVTAVKISYFNLTTNPDDSTTHLTTKLNLTLSAKNTNKKAIFYYDAVSVKVSSRSAILSSISYADSFTNSPGSTYVIHASTGVTNSQVDVGDPLNLLKSDLKRRNGVPVRIEMDMMLGVKFEKFKVRKIGIRVKCDGIKGLVPKGNSTAAANLSGAKCKVDLRIKVFKWTF